MLFQFEHVDLDSGPGGKWNLKPLNLLDLKRNLTKWQNALEEVGWNSLYFCNHDQPRVVSRFGNDKEYRLESAKMLATIIHMMRGTPYVYQGEELGMTNVPFSSIEDYRDIETLNFYKEKVAENVPVESIMRSIYVKGRDNARTPMQWDDSENAGFTIGTPWIKVNPNYKEINVKKAVEDKNSVFHYYKQLIQLRKDHEIVVYGKYNLIDENDPEIFAYTREHNGKTLLVICNFYGNEPSFEIPEELKKQSYKHLLGNYSFEETDSVLTLRPYESQILLFEK
jgi:oligo-1,6-glucosidase